MDFATKQDLVELEQRILSALKDLLLTNEQPGRPKRWLKTKEVLELLQVSSSTLQTLRGSGEIMAKKIGGTLYYDADDIFRKLKGAA